MKNAWTIGRNFKTGTTYSYNYKTKELIIDQINFGDGAPYIKTVLQTSGMDDASEKMREFNVADNARRA